MNNYSIETRPLVVATGVHVWQILQDGREVLRDVASNDRAARRAARAALKVLQPSQAGEGDGDEGSV